MTNQHSDPRVQLVRVSNACEQLDIGNTKCWALIREDELEVVRFGPRCTRIVQPSIDALIARKRGGGSTA